MLLLAVVAVAVAAAAYFLAPRLTGDTAAVGTPTGSGVGAAGETGAAGQAASTSSAPYTVKPEPTRVATDAPVSSSKNGGAQVVLTYASFDDSTGTVQASGLVAGVIEDGGTCTLTLTQDGDEVTARSTGSADATTTTCGLLQTGTGLAAGTWKAVLSYTSDDAEGTSQSMQVTVR